MKRLRALRVSVFFTHRALPGLCVVILLVATAPFVSAQPRFDGYATLMLDHLPELDPSVTELRARFFGELTVRTSDVLALTASGYADGLAADRAGAVYDGILRPHELLADFPFTSADLRVGLGRVVWGRLDEVSPGDVVNPLDLSRFFFEGRSEARLPVALVRGRWFITDEATLEGVYVPVFRRGRFDQLDEPTSPFNLRSDIVGCLGIGVCPDPPVAPREPPATFENTQGGVRFSATARRVDFAIAAYRGFRPFGSVAAEPEGTSLRLVERFPRFTMVSADFESVRGLWAFRGEAAIFDEEEDFRPAALGGLPGRSWDAGFAIDRKTGEYRLSGSVLVSGADRTIVNLVFGGDRSFSRDRYTTRAFGLINVTDGSSFLRNVTTMTVRDNVAVEGSIGWFFGESRDAIGRFADRDFLYARLKLYF
jgi:hypothetical protein